MTNFGSTIKNAFFRMVYTLRNVGKLESERSFNLTELEQTKQKLVSLRFKKNNYDESAITQSDSKVVNFPGNKVSSGIYSFEVNNNEGQNPVEESYTIEQLNSLTVNKHKLMGDPLISSHVEFNSVLTVIK